MNAAAATHAASCEHGCAANRPPCPLRLGSRCTQLQHCTDTTAPVSPTSYLPSARHSQRPCALTLLLAGYRSEHCRYLVALCCLDLKRYQDAEAALTREGPNKVGADNQARAAAAAAAADVIALDKGTADCLTTILLCLFSILGALWRCGALPPGPGPPAHLPRGGGSAALRGSTAAGPAAVERLCRPLRPR
jgi:hypothetical protein